MKQKADLAAEKLDYNLKYNQKYIGNGGCARVSPTLIKTLMQGVITPQDKKDELNQTSLIPPIQADNALNALIEMPEDEYLSIIKVISPEDLVQAALVLKAIGARKEQFQEKEQVKSASKEVREFASKLSGVKSQDRLKMTSLRDVQGRKEGLRQRFTNSCGPTSMQVMHGELDPVYALQVNQAEDLENESLNPESPVAREQATMLKSNNLPPLGFELLYDKLVVELKEIGSEGEPLLAWLRGSGKASQAQKFSEVTKIPKELLMAMRKFFPFKAPGANFQRIEDLGKEVGKKTSVCGYGKSYFDGASPSDQDMEEIDNALLNGQPVPIAVNFSDQKVQYKDVPENERIPGHEMVLVDIRGDKPENYEYLIYEPTYGKSQWKSRAELQKGKFNLLGNTASIVHTFD